MESDLTSVTYSVPFATALARLPKRHAAGQFGIARADQVDRDALFTLDTELRGDTPGNDGWEGNRAWFDSELESAEFDPTGYLVAIDHHSGHLIGLCRMWRNQTGPTLGLLGIRRDRRNGFTAAAVARDPYRVEGLGLADVRDPHGPRAAATPPRPDGGAADRRLPPIRQVVTRNRAWMMAIERPDQNAHPATQSAARYRHDLGAVGPPDPLDDASADRGWRCATRGAVPSSGRQYRALCGSRRRVGCRDVLVA